MAKIKFNKNKMDLKSIIQATEQIAKDKGIPVEKVYEAIEGRLPPLIKKSRATRVR